ncbi:MAG: hypothetical protein KJ886_03555 [Candidatus Thermoplasmatota archaeon]|nr:hypothetical protein [Candidatus Thermoplasmatota archaeon]MBU4256501.1 hypothetical protein [Candidatus Thermoplasmatota archaeon]MCG2826478.1 hypothetical protein [Thermoplasmatales archaeon]
MMSNENYRSLKDKFYVEFFGNRKLVFSTPHHAPKGYQSTVTYDENTDYLGALLAKELEGKFVSARELREVVDVNKDPINIKDAEKKLLTLHYQNLLFENDPQFIVELHGHVSGRYDIEISTGYMLDLTERHDQILLKKLEEFKNSLKHHLDRLYLQNNIRQFSTLGIFPIDEDVIMRATQTYTFQKIRKLRNLGIDKIGLHIELHRSLRVLSGSSEYPLTGLLFVQAFRNAFKDIFITPKTINSSEHVSNTSSEIKESSVPTMPLHLKVFKIPREYVGRGVALMSSDDMETLHLKNDDRTIIKHRNLSVTTKVEGANRERGFISLPATIRNKLNVDRMDTVSVKKDVLQSAVDTNMNMYPNSFYLKKAGSRTINNRGTAFLSSKTLHTLGLNIGDPITVIGKKVTMKCHVQSGDLYNISPREVIMSIDDMNAIYLSYGDVVNVYPLLDWKDETKRLKIFDIFRRK